MSASTSRNTASGSRTSNLFLVPPPDLTGMSFARVFALLALLTVWVGAAVGAGCLGESAPGAGESSTGSPSSGTDGTPGGSNGPASDTTIPVPIPVGS